MEKTIEKNRKELGKFLDNRLGEVELSTKMQKIDKIGLLVSYDFNCLYASAQTDENSFWPEIEKQIICNKKIWAMQFVVCLTA